MAQIASTWSAAEGASGGLVPVRVHVLLAKGEPGVTTARLLHGFSPGRLSRALEASDVALPDGRIVVDMSPGGDRGRDMSRTHLAAAAALMALAGELDPEAVGRAMLVGDLLATGEADWGAAGWHEICRAAGTVGAEPAAARSVRDLPRALGSPAREGGRPESGPTLAAAPARFRQSQYYTTIKL